MAESGLARYQFTTWFGLFAPKETPAAITQSIYAAVREASQSADLQKAIAAAGAEPLANTPAEFAAQVRKDDDRFTALAKRFPLD